MGRLYSAKVDVPLHASGGESVTLRPPTDSTWSKELGGVLATQTASTRLASSECFATAEGSDPDDPFSVRFAVKLEVDVIASPGRLAADHLVHLAVPGHAFGFFADRHVTTLEITNCDQPTGTAMLQPSLTALDPTPSGGFSTISYSEQDGVSAQGGSFMCLSIDHNDAKTASVQVPDFTLSSVRDGDKAVFHREYSRPGMDSSPYDQSRPGSGLLSAPYIRLKAGEVVTKLVVDSFGAIDPANQVITEPAPVTTSDQTYTSQALWSLEWSPDRTIREPQYRIGLTATHTTRYVFVVTYDWDRWTDDLLHGRGVPIWDSWTTDVTTTYTGDFSPRELWNTAWKKIEGQRTNA